MTKQCFACEKPIKNRGFLVITRDGQTGFVGPDCFARVRQADDAGYQPPLGGPRLYEIDPPVEIGEASPLDTDEAA